MTGLYALASAGLVCMSFLAGRRFPAVPRRDVVGAGARAAVASSRPTGPVAAPADGVSADAFAALDRRVTALERSARRRPRPERVDRADRLDRAERGERSDRGERPERSERADRGDRNARVLVRALLAEEAPLDKPRTLSHYEALADQVARERQDDVEPRGRVMKFPSRPLAIAREHQDR